MLFYVKKKNLYILIYIIDCMQKRFCLVTEIPLMSLCTMPFRFVYRTAEISAFSRSFYSTEIYISGVWYSNLSAIEGPSGYFNLIFI